MDSKWKTHEAYIGAVAAALEAAGFKVDDWWADDNDPRDGWIGFDMDQQGTIDGKPLRTVLAGLERDGLIRCAVRAGSGTTFEVT